MHCRNLCRITAHWHLTRSCFAWSCETTISSNCTYIVFLLFVALFRTFNVLSALFLILVVLQQHRVFGAGTAQSEQRHTDCVVASLWYQPLLGVQYVLVCTAGSSACGVRTASWQKQELATCFKVPYYDNVAPSQEVRRLIALSSQ